MSINPCLEIFNISKVLTFHLLKNSFKIQPNDNCVLQQQIQHKRTYSFVVS